MLEEWNPQGWEKVKIKNISLDFGRGKSKHRPRDDTILYGGNYPFIQTGDVKRSFGRITKYSQTYNEKGLSQSKLWPAETMCITIAANIAETGILTFPACFPDSIIGFVADKKKSNVYFVEYLFRYLRYYIQSEYVGTGTAQDNINLGTFEELEFPIPPLSVQNKIVSILKPFDDLIFNIKNKNEKLEQIVKTIFKSWFIDFDGQMEFVESELGKIPKGWMIKKMSEISEVKIGRTPPRKEAEWFTKNIGMKWVSIRDMGLSNTFLHYTLENLTDDAIKNLKIPIIEKGMVLLSFKLTVGRVAIASEKMVSNEAIAHFKISEPSLNNYYLYEVLKNFNYDSLGSTSSIATAINSTNIKDMKIIVPTIEILNQFKETVERLFSQINVEQKKIQILSNTRDLLLIKLVSGEIRV